MNETLGTISLGIIALLAFLFSRPPSKKNSVRKVDVKAPPHHKVQHYTAIRSKRLALYGFIGEGAYRRYLSSPHWKRKIGPWVRRTRKWICMACGSRVKLILHHCDYSRVGAEKLEDIILLCGKHHSQTHEIEHHTGDLLHAHQVLWRQRKKDGLRVGPWC